MGMVRTARRQREIETMHSQNLRLRSTLQDIAKIAGRSGPESMLVALIDIEGKAKAALKYQGSSSRTSTEKA